MANIEQFNKMASGYESEQRVELLSLFTRLVSDNAVSGSLLDFGCGPGNLGINLSDKFDTIYLLDPAESMQVIAKDKIEKFGLTNCYVIGNDLEQEEHLDIKVDNIVIAQVLLHIPEYKQLLAKLVDSLKPGGKIFIFDYYHNPQVTNPLVHNGFIIDQLTAYLEQLGLKNISDTSIYESDNLLLGAYGNLFMLQANIK